MGREVTAAEFRARLSPEDAARFDRDIHEGKGYALYVDQRGAPRLVASYGPRGADIVGMPPRGYGQSDWELAEFCPPQKIPADMRSPLLDAVPVPQIKSPPRGQSKTLYPEVLTSMRASPHPRGITEIQDARRAILRPLGHTHRLPPAEPGHMAEEEPLSEGAAWWRSKLG